MTETTKTQAEIDAEIAGANADAAVSAAAQDGRGGLARPQERPRLLRIPEGLTEIRMSGTLTHTPTGIFIP